MTFTITTGKKATISLEVVPVIYPIERELTATEEAKALDIVNSRINEALSRIEQNIREQGL